MNRKAAVRLALLLLLAGGVAWALTARDEFDPQRLEAILRGLGWAAPLAFMALFAAATVLFLPGVAFALIGGALFGPVLGTVYNLLGATAGAVAAFLAARHLAADWTRARTGPRLSQVIEGVEAEGWRFVAVVRLVPLFPFNLMNYALGLTRIGLAEYTLATLVCMIPGGFVYTYLGHAGREALGGGEGAVQKVLVAAGLLALVALLPRLVRRWRGGGGERIAIGAVKRRIDAADDLLVLDVRDAADFVGAGGHVSGARNIPLPELATRLAELEEWRDRPLAVICRTDKRSRKAADLLRERGFRQVLLVEGGMAEWAKQGFPAEGAAAS